MPGTWLSPPAVGLLWTPGYWGCTNGAYFWNAGYWGPHIGFYGGINYGFGYVGHGFDGGYWDHGAFYYNRSVNNISNTNITNVYNRTVVNNTTITNVSYNGGPGGIRAQANPRELAVAREPHVLGTPLQTRHIEAARAERALRAGLNHGVPPVAATPIPARFSGPNVAPARGFTEATRPAGASGAAAITANPRNEPSGSRMPPPAQAATGPRVAPATGTDRAPGETAKAALPPIRRANEPAGSRTVVTASPTPGAPLPRPALPTPGARPFPLQSLAQSRLPNSSGPNGNADPAARSAMSANTAAPHPQAVPQPAFQPSGHPPHPMASNQPQFNHPFAPQAAQRQPGYPGGQPHPYKRLPNYAGAAFNPQVNRPTSPPPAYYQASYPPAPPQQPHMAAPARQVAAPPRPAPFRAPAPHVQMAARAAPQAHQPRMR